MKELIQHEDAPAALGLTTAKLADFVTVLIVIVATVAYFLTR